MIHPYMPRIVDSVLQTALASSGAVLIEGAKWCGKTRTAKERASSILALSDPDRRAGYLRAADTTPSLLLKGPTPRLIDEWQIAPVLWDAVRYVVDERGVPGQFILTGSAVPREDGIRHTGTGRISRILMRPMSLFESNESSGSVSLGELFERRNGIEGVSSLTIEALAFALARGGWPAAIVQKSGSAARSAYDYVEAVINADITSVDGVERSPARVRTLMRSLARNQSTTASLATIMGDVASDERSIGEKTVASYLNALRRIFVVDDLAAWNPALRSKTALRTSPKRYFVDPSIASAVLRASPEGLLDDFNTFGLMFEALCIRDLRIYAQAIDGEVFHYRDSTDLEADAIVHLKDGRWGAIEIKLGSKEIEIAARNLLKLKDRIDEDRMRAPSFLMVLTGTEHAYRRADGVLVVPIACLRN